ncbi:MAG: trypsin-like peptidase domain-containing protein [Oscillospiraceae bacterium]
MSEQENNFGNIAADPPQPNGEGTEYNYTREDIPHRSYMDANYAPKAEEPVTPRYYYTPPEKPAKKKREKKSHKGFLKVASLCLVCALLGSIGGGVIVASQMPKFQEKGGSVLNVAPPGETQSPSVVASSGKELSGEQVYALGCKQAVGISTEITYTNYFGMKSSAAVSGSGFIVTSDGYIVTNYHVIKNAYLGGYKISVMLNDGSSHEAKIVGGEEQFDLAVLKIDAKGLDAATLGDSASMKVGETVHAIGNPLGELAFTMTSGTVSALDRKITTSDRETGTTVTNNMFQIDAAVNDGNSGGPVYNSRGEVIGIVTAKYSSAGVEGLGFAIPINDAATIIDQLIQNGSVSSGKVSFGITAGTVDSAAAQYYNMTEGVFVNELVPGGCSEKAGVKAGDIITAVDGTPIKTMSDLSNIKKNYVAGDTVTVEIFRGGETLEVKIKLDQAVEPKDVAKPDAGNTKPLPVLPKQ